MSAEFDRLVAEFDKFQSKLKRVDEQFGSVEAMQAELSALNATATSPDRSVTVVAGPGGSVQDVRFSEEALKQRPEALSASVMSTLRQAIAESARKQASIVDQHMGGSMQLTEQVLESQSELLGTSVEELRAKLDEEVPSAPKSPEEESHDDYSHQSVLRETEDSTPAPPSPPASAGDGFLKNLFDEEDHR